MNYKNCNIGVLGAGSWGTALAILLARNNSKSVVTLWGHDCEHLALMKKTRKNLHYLPDIELPENILITDFITELVVNTKDLVFAVPSKAFRQVLQEIKPYLSKEHRIVCASKGLESSTGLFLHQVAEEVCGDICYAVLSGPSFAKEVAIGLPTSVNIASKNTGFVTDLVKYFSSDCFNIEPCEDLIGVQLCGVVKNIIAVAVGLADGLQLGANARATIITMGLCEARKLGEKLGAMPETFLGLSGIGDTVLTSTDNQSRNRRFGVLLSSTKNVELAQRKTGQIVEAVSNIEVLSQLTQKYGVETSVIKQIYAVLHGKDPKIAMADLLS